MQKFANGQLLGALIFTLPAGNAFLHRAFDFLILLFRRVGAKISGISTPAGQGMQYSQWVQLTRAECSNTVFAFM